MAAAGLVVGVLVAMPVSAQGTATPRLPDNSAAAAAQSASDEIRALDQQVQVVLAEARRQQELLAVQRQRLAAAEAGNAWLPWLVMAVLALAVLAGWLGLRLWRLQRQQLQAPAAAPAPVADPAAIDMASLVAAAMPDESVLRHHGRPLLSTAGSHAGLGSASHSEMTQGQPRIMPAPPAPAASGMGLGTRDFSFNTGAPQRPVSVEELLDLDQQVEFFLVLGQAQSAIDLLLSHVRGTGGTSALPYFKLLEIYHQQGDEEAYERTRERFNQRFNAHAPDWSGELTAGRALEDYPEVVQRLQRAWPQPVRAVAELEGLLLRRADLEPFDLPAYRELLMLHALVRDLPSAPASAAPLLATPPITTPSVLTHVADEDPDADVLDSGPGSHQAIAPSRRHAMPQTVDAVDLLLPLDDGPMDITAPRPHLSERSSAQSMLADWVFSRAAMVQRPGEGDGGTAFDRAQVASSRPMALDLDLSELAPAPREYTRPAAFTDLDVRRDKRLSDFGGLDGIDSDPAHQPSRR